MALIIGMLMFHLLKNVYGCGNVVEGQTMNIPTPKLKSISNTIKKDFKDLLLKPVGTILVNELHKINKEFMIIHRINNIVDHLAEVYHKKIDWSDKLGPISTLNTHADVCWAVSIIYTIKGAIVLSDIPETNNYEPSIQQLLDCISDNPSDTYTDGYFTINLPFTIYNTYIKNTRQIYSESDYPTIVNDCNIYLTDQDTVFCNHFDLSKMNIAPSELGRGLDNYDEKYQVVACRGDIYDTCNDSKDISDPRGWGGNCWGHISDNGIKINCSASGTGTYEDQTIPGATCITDTDYNSLNIWGKGSDRSNCNNFKGSIDYYCNNLSNLPNQNPSNVEDFNNCCCNEINTCVPEAVPVNGGPPDGWYNDGGKCQSLELLEENNYFSDNLQHVKSICGDNDNCEESWMSIRGTHLNCTTDLNNRCIQSCKTMDKQPEIFIDEIVHVINDDKHIFDALRNHVLACSILMIEELYPHEDYYDIEDDQEAYNNCRIDFDTPGVEDYIVDSCIYDFDGATCGEYVEYNYCCNETIGFTCNDNRFPIEGGYCLKEQSGYLSRITEIDGNNITNEEQCNQNNGQWINERFSGNYPDKEFCKNECQNNINNCYVNANHSLLIVGTDYYNGKYYWKIRNNWGNEWGHNGCFYLQRDIDSEGNIGRRNLFGINEFVYYVTVKTNPN